MDLTPVVLESNHVRLEPLTKFHADDLVPFALDDSLWRHTSTALKSRADLDAYIASALDAQRAHMALPFAIVDRTTGKAIGSTRFGNVDHPNRRAEIGWTWLGRRYQRTAFNTEAKLLMLEHAFDRLGCVRIELRTGVNNVISRAAIRRLGAVEEGVFRHHLVLPDGRLRDTVCYSILRDEWPSVRANLRDRLSRHR